MTFTGIPNQSRSVTSASYKIVVGNAINGDTQRDCNILDPGDGSGVKSAVQQAYDIGLRTVGPVLSVCTVNTATAAVWTAI